MCRPGRPPSPSCGPPCPTLWAFLDRGRGQLTCRSHLGSEGREGGPGEAKQAVGIQPKPRGSRGNGPAALMLQVSCGLCFAVASSSPPQHAWRQLPLRGLRPAQDPLARVAPAPAACPPTQAASFLESVGTGTGPMPMVPEVALRLGSWLRMAGHQA